MLIKFLADHILQSFLDREFSAFENMERSQEDPDYIKKFHFFRFLRVNHNSYHDSFIKSTANASCNIILSPL